MSEREIRILLADDDQIIRDGLTNLLNAQEGLRVVATVVNGAQVFDQLALHRVDVALLDVDMPVMSGIEAARRISHEQPGITIIMLTAFEHEESLGQAIGAGVRGFLTKDIPAPELAQLIRNAYGGQQVMAPRPPPSKRCPKPQPLLRHQAAAQPRPPRPQAARARRTTTRRTTKPLLTGWSTPMIRPRCMTA